MKNVFPVLSPIKMEKKGILKRMRQLLKERRMVQLAIDLETKDFGKPISDLSLMVAYAEKYQPEKIDLIRQQLGSNSNDLLQNKTLQDLLVESAIVIDTCIDDKYLKHFKDQITIESKGRKFVQIEYFINTLGTELGILWSMLVTGAGGLIAGLLIKWVWGSLTN